MLRQNLFATQKKLHGKINLNLFLAISRKTQIYVHEEGAQPI